MDLKISSGKIPRAQKVVLYGLEGIGKTTLAAQTPDPLFIDTEGGTAHMDVKRIEGIEVWEQLLDAIKTVAVTPDICKTLVIDTADWAEKACFEYVLRHNNWDSIESPGYGKGYNVLEETFLELLKACDKVLAAGMNVVFTAHAQIKKLDLPEEMGSYDRWELKLEKKNVPLLKEWADVVLFLNYKTLVVTTDTKAKKGTNGKRMIYTTHKPAFDAKNRHGLPDEMEMKYSNIACIFNDDPVRYQISEAPKATSSGETMEKPREPITAETYSHLCQMMEEAGIKAEEVQALVEQRTGKYTAETPISEYSEKFVQNWLLKHWDKMVETINPDSDELPF